LQTLWKIIVKSLIFVHGFNSVWIAMYLTPSFPKLSTISRMPFPKTITANSGTSGKSAKEW